jgi:hypothetical protein
MERFYPQARGNFRLFHGSIPVGKACSKKQPATRRRSNKAGRTHVEYQCQRAPDALIHRNHTGSIPRSADSGLIGSEPIPIKQIYKNRSAFTFKTFENRPAIFFVIRRRPFSNSETIV